MEPKHIEIFKGQKATDYDRFITELFPSYSLFKQSVPKILKQQLATNIKPKILVAGCGTGNEAKLLVQYNQYWYIDACDPSEEMLAFAKTKLTPYKKVRLIKGTVDELELKESYEAATLFLVLHFLIDEGSKLALIKDIAQRLKPGGTLLLFDISGGEKELLDTFAIQSALFPEYWSPKDIAERKIRITKRLHAIPNGRCEELLQEAGFAKAAKFHQFTICSAWITTKIQNNSCLHY
ncbi:MAG: tRNA (cmo5U34)-methyltransferase [Patiriisocius sp.]|jgi:tRNA (cmo5U34)-methyltransferase